MAGEPASTGDPAEPYRSSLGWLLNKAAQRLTGALEQALTPYGLKTRDYGVMALLDQPEPRSQQQVGAVLHVDRSQMVLVVDALERAGYVVRTRSTVDRRAYVLKLTPAGSEFLHGTLDKLILGVEDEALGLLSPTERRDLNRLLAKLVDSLQSPRD